MNSDGNSSVHYRNCNLSEAICGIEITRDRFSATSVDQLAHHVAAYLMFGHQLVLPIPDVDRTEFLLMLGANPAASNGSMMTAPGMPQRLKDIRARGGKVILIDPRRYE